MPNTLPDSNVVRCSQHPGKLESKSLEAIDQLLLILPAKIPASLWRQIPHGNKLQALLRKRTSGDVPALQTRLGNKRQTLVVAGKIGSDDDTFARLTLARKLVSAATGEKAGCLGIAVLGFDADDAESLSNAAVAGPPGAPVKNTPVKRTGQTPKNNNQP